MRVARELFVLTLLVSLLCGMGFAGDEKDKKKADEKTAATAVKDIEMKACGAKEKEVKFDADTDKNSHPTPAPAEGKAIVYVLRPTMMGNKVQTRFAVDGEWKGVNRGNNYFFVELAPGEHFFCSAAENRDALALTLEPGKTYYLQQHVQMGFMKARTSLDQMPEDKAKEKLAKLHLATWTEK